MSVFGAYAHYYDLFYGDKDYAEEAAFVDGCLREAGAADASILELGCGTGKHARELIALGNRVHGIDRSETMLEDAARLAANMDDGEREAFTFELGDARTYRAGRTFDAVISLFHVMSYQTSNADLLNAFTTAAAHLEPGGTFLFDCWYGPAVLTQRPEVREKTLENDVARVTRVATPVMRPNEDVCEVHYDITAVSKADGSETKLAENHPMRYLFSPELELALGECGFDITKGCEFVTGAPLGFDTWNACFVATKR